MDIITEFIEALDSEIKAIKYKSHQNIVFIYNGIFLRKTLEFYLYEFTLENFLVVLDDTPARIEINNDNYDCNIISVVGQKVQLSLNEKLSEFIPEAKLKTDLSFLLERLKKKYEENRNNINLFDNSLKLFNGVFSKIGEGNFKSTYSISEIIPNSSQQDAIDSSINDFISIIWGPPGTGKTETIAKAIESHLNLDRKVLLLSHSNNAVDEALEKVANQTINTYYKNCELVRLGTPKNDKLEKFQNEKPYVLIDKISEKKSEELISQKREFENKISSIKSKIDSYKKVIVFMQEIQTLNNSILKITIEIEDDEGELISLNEKNSELNNDLAELQKSFIKAQNSSSLKKIILGINEKKISEKINKTKSMILETSSRIEILKTSRFRKNVQIKQYKNELLFKENYLKEKLKSGKTFTKLTEELKELKNEIVKIETELISINKKIEEIKEGIILNAKLIATTLTKSYLSKEIENLKFDILIIDESSMSPLPMIFWAATKITKGISIVGDFKQLPPICLSDEAIAQKWLGRNIYDVFGIDDVETIDKNKIKLLNIQYRMNPKISKIPNEVIYKSLLKNGENTNDKYFYDEISENNPTCLIDTSNQNPWCSQLESGSRINLINALLCVNLAEKVFKTSDKKDISIGIITPYRKQATLIFKMVEDNDFLKNSRNLRINTIHSFQGGQESVIIFDSVEGIGSKKWSLLDEMNNDSANQIVNVAITRAQSKLYFIGNSNYLFDNLSFNSLLRILLKDIEDCGVIINSRNIFDGFNTQDSEYWIKKINSLDNRSYNFEQSYNEREFWPAFINDLSQIQNELVIFSPFITTDRVSKLSNYFNELLSNDIKIFIITRPPNQQPNIMREGAIQSINHLKSIGIIIKFRNNMHEKIALIDREIEWFGSLNILSHRDTNEEMKRFVGNLTAQETYKKYELDNLFDENNLVGESCPMCDGFIVKKTTRRYPHRDFYGCSNYPECKWIKNIKTNYRRR